MNKTDDGEALTHMVNRPVGSRLGATSISVNIARAKRPVGSCLGATSISVNIARANSLKGRTKVHPYTIQLQRA